MHTTYTGTLEPPGLQQFSFHSRFGKHDSNRQSSNSEEQLRLVERIAEYVKGAGRCDPAAKEVETIAKDHRRRLEERRGCHNFSDSVDLRKGGVSIAILRFAK